MTLHNHTSFTPAAKVAAALEEDHVGYDTAIRSRARLIAAIVEARMNCGHSGVIAQDVIVSAIHGLQVLGQARGASIDLHGQLEELGVQIGLIARGEGGLVPKGRQSVAVVALQQAA